MKILVTGALGQLGQELQNKAKTSAHEFIFTDVDSLNILEEKKILDFIQDKRIDTVINCAAYTAVDRAEDESKLAFEINAVGPKNLAIACKVMNASLIHISTDYVFDGKKSHPYLEDDEKNPTSIYGQSKLEGEKNIISHGNRAAIIRTSWLYSPYGANFVKSILKLLEDGKPLRIVNDQIGSPTYAGDLADILLLHSNSLVPSSGVEIFHYTNDGVASWYDFAVAIKELNRRSQTILPVRSSEYPTKATRPNYSVLSKEKIKTHLKIQIPFWKTSLKECMKSLSK
ncbi:MAG: dTDP-4-dehydrorhamnose reductase [Bacteriovoracaceae bacterium]|nr:dTDP-4-dehydrorhamnose reductase [Bacteriovoracaceae bacterium]